MGESNRSTSLTALPIRDRSLAPTRDLEQRLVVLENDPSARRGAARIVAKPFTDRTDQTDLSRGFQGRAARGRIGT
jgi:hypothetical protein